VSLTAAGLYYLTNITAHGADRRIGRAVLLLTWSR
jgi:hypothetical protein